MVLTIEPGTADAIAQFTEAAKQLNHFVRMGVVSLELEKEFAAKFGIKSAPSILLFPYGDNHKKPEKYSGAFQATAITNFGLAQMPSFLNRVTTSSYPTFIRENPSKPKVLLFITKSQTVHLYKALAIDFKNELSFGTIYNTESQLARKFAVRNFPTLAILLTPDSSPVLFEGNHNYEDIEKFLQEELKIATQQRQEDVSGTFTELAKDSKGLCPTDKLCFIFSISSETKASHLRTLAEMQTLYKKFPFIWVDRAKQQDFLNAFAEFPSNGEGVLVLNSKRKKYASSSELTKEGVSLFIDRVTSGDIKWEKIKSSPLEKLQ